MTDLDGASNDDPFLLRYQPSDLRIASEFLTNWLPFLSRGLCHRCTQTLSDRIRSLDPESDGKARSADGEKIVVPSIGNGVELQEDCCDKNSTGSCNDGDDTNSLGSWKDGANGWSEPFPESSARGILGQHPSNWTPSPRMSWADMAQEDELIEEEEQRDLGKRVVNVSPSTGELMVSKVVEKPKLSREQREYIRFMNVERKKDFISLERVKGKFVNVLEGLELHTGVFSAAEQKRIVDFVYSIQEMGKRGELKERTYTAPQKWMRGKGRVTVQFGCCYNYATDKEGNPPGILQNKIVDPIPGLFKVIIRRLVRWHVLPPSCVPDSCIVNIYEEGDCIPPHIDNHDFVRPFCTVSFLSECNIVFGTDLKVLGAGDFVGSIAIPLPVGSVLVLNGNGANVAKHCVPSVPTKSPHCLFCAGYQLHLEKWMRQSSLWGSHQNLICRVFSLCHMKWTTQTNYILINLNVMLKGNLVEETVRWKLGNLLKIPNQNAFTQLVVDDGLQISGGQRWILAADG